MATSVDEKLLKATKFPPEFNKKVDMKKVNVEVIKKYIPPAHAMARNARLTFISLPLDGSPEKSLKSLGMKMTLLSSYASTCWKARAMYEPQCPSIAVAFANRLAAKY
jgi:hypothetical protein